MKSRPSCNDENPILNSVAIIEAPATDRQLYYMVAVMSNVLRNSAVVHQTLATRIHRMLEKFFGMGKFSSNGSQAGK